MYMKKYTVRKRHTKRRRRRQNKRNGGLVMPWSRSNVKPPASDTKLAEFKQKFETTEQTLKAMKEELAAKGFAVLYGLNDNTMDISIKTRILEYLEKGNIDVAEKLMNEYLYFDCHRNPDIMRNPDAVSKCIKAKFAEIEQELIRK